MNTTTATKHFFKKKTAAVSYSYCSPLFSLNKYAYRMLYSNFSCFFSLSFSLPGVMFALMFYIVLYSDEKKMK